jgi:4-hydroxy-tetrahydrodipicolinate synthase
MARRGEMFAGLSVALVTPMHSNGSLNEDMLKTLIDFHIEAGTDALVPVGYNRGKPHTDTRRT